MPRSIDSRNGKERKLPKQQLAILAICRFAEPFASTSIYPYLPEMIRSFGIPEEGVGKWAGACAAAFSFAQAAMGIPWGRASDRYGRKSAILLGLTITMVTSLMWGFSTTLWMAILARAINGAGNGNVGIIRTTVAEMVPYKELQPIAFSIMPLVWNLGSIFGPSIGGALANPLKVSALHRPSNGSLLEVYPYALPNIVSACFFAISITTGILFLHETLETKKHNRDHGIMLGKKLVAAVKLVFGRVRRYNAVQLTDEQEPFLRRSDVEDGSDSPNGNGKPVNQAPPPWSEVLTRQVVLNLACYWLLAMHTMTYDMILPVLMDGKPLPHEAGSGLKFYGGFGLTHTQMGALSTCYGIFSMVVQFFLFPPVARRFGILYCLKWCAIVFPITYALTPFSVLMPEQWSQVAVCFAIQLVKGVCAIFAFPCSTILLTNSATSLRTLGTVNGIATTISALGRGLGPAIAGFMYSEGHRLGMVVIPWWFLAGISVLAAVPVWTLVEGQGFADAVSEHDEDELVDHDEDSLLTCEAVDGGAQATGGKPGPEVLAARERRL